MTRDERPRDPDPTRLDPGGDSDPDLLATIRERIRRDGPLTFARFMELALYDPAHGYYMAPRERADRGGDFLTAPEATPLFGACVARQVEEIWRRLGGPAPFVLREYGAGSGALALAILDRLREDASALLAGLRYAPVEVNPHRRQEIADRLGAAGFARLLSDGDGAGPMTGCVLANEFVDALPVHRVRCVGGELRELYVDWRDGWLRQVPGSPSTDALAAYLERVGAHVEDGQETEVNLGARAWLERVAADLTRGVVLIVDYGYEAAELHGVRRPEGTIKGSRAQTLERDPLRNVGRQDLTAHVDLTELRLAASDLGLDVLGSTTQAEFLAGTGFGDLLRDALGRETSANAYLATRSAAMFLLDPRRTGGFRVLALGRGVPPEPPLRGLSVRIGREG